MLHDDDDEISALDREIERADRDGNDYAEGLCLMKKAQLQMSRGEVQEAMRNYRNACSRFVDARQPELLSEALLTQSQFQGDIADGTLRIEIALCRYLYCINYVHDDAAVREEQSRMMDVTRSHVSPTSAQFAYIRFWFLYYGLDDWAAIASLCRTASRQAQPIERTSSWATLEHFLTFAYFGFALSNADDSAREIKRMIQRAGGGHSIPLYQKCYIDFADRVRSTRETPSLENLDRLAGLDERCADQFPGYCRSVAKLLHPRIYASRQEHDRAAQEIRSLMCPRRPGRPPIVRSYMLRWRIRVLIALWRLNRLRYAMRLPLADVELQLGLPTPIYDANETVPALEPLSRAASRTLALLARRAQRLNYRHDTSGYTKFADALRESLAEAQSKLT